MPISSRTAIGMLALGTVAFAAACGSPGTAAVPPGVIPAVGAENQYANVIAQVGGKYVRATAIESNPNTDPHTFEASASVARAVSGARVVVQNGLGYDSYMNKIEAASPNAKRTVIDAQQVLGLPDSTPNPHLWYDPATMPAVAKAVTRALSAIQPGHAGYFQARLRAFNRSLQPWFKALAQFRADHPAAPVAVTEPVGNYLLRAAGAATRTPWTLQAAVMNGVDPAPQDVSIQESLLAGHKVMVLLYNQQVADSLTQTFLAVAHEHGVPVVGVYETMPAGYDYQSWMLAETTALQRAVADRVSTQELAR